MQKIPVYVISLERARKRRALITAHLNGLNIEYRVIDAVDGKLLDPGYRKKLNPAGNMSSAVLGCYLSHIRVYEDIAANRIPVALILEDDTVLHYRVKALLDNGCQNLDFDYCFLGSDDSGDEGFVYYDADSAVDLGNGHVAYLLSAGPFCNNAYLVTLQGVQKRMACAFPARTAIDHYHYLPYRPRFRAIIPMVAFLNEQSAVNSMSSEEWTFSQKLFHRFWWFYPLRDLGKLKALRKLSELRNHAFPHSGTWRSFASAFKVVTRNRLEP